MRALAVAVLVIAGCDAPREALPQRRDPGALVVAQAADIITLDPVRATDSESIEIIDILYEGLVGWRAGTTDLEPRLATSWRTSDDGRTTTFELRPHVRFHDGTALDAEAVVFSFERLLVKEHPFAITEGGNYWRSMLADVESVKATGPLVVEIRTRRSYTPLLPNLAKYGIVSPTAVKKWGADFAEHPVGTGPFVFEDWAKGSRVLVRRNLLYWGAPAALNQIVFQVVGDARQRLINLESGSVDLATAIIPDEQPFVELHPDLVLHHTSGNNVSYLALNTSHPPFNDVRVRRAANYAVNKEPIVKLGYQGRATAADSPLPPQLWAYHSPKTQYGHEPNPPKPPPPEAAAHGALQPNRTPPPPPPPPPRPPPSPPERVARYIQASLAQAGIRTRLVLQPYAEHRAAVQHGDHDLGVFGWVGDTGDPDNFLMVLLSSKQAEGVVAQNIAYYKSADVDQLLLEAQGESDTQKRALLYARIQDMIAEDAPWVPLAHSELVVAGRVELERVVLSPTGRPIYALIRRRTGAP